MSRHKHKLRFIGIFLSVILSVSSVPLYAFASGTYDTGGAAAEEVTVSCEYVAKRGEFEKHYLLSDGSLVAVSYPEAIHYRNADGEWEDIDSSLHAEASSSRIVTGDCGTFAASFSTSRRAGRLVSLSNREFSLSWSLSGDGERMVSSSPVLAASSSSVMQARAKISDSITGKPVSDSETFALRGASGSVGYSALFADAPEISAEYTVYRNKIEEDIYINSPTDLRSLRMEFDTAGLTAEVKDDGSVEFLDENGEMRFRIGIPYMEDAANEILTDIHVNAEQNGDSCTVTYTPDEEWLSSSERSYPILFDPSVTTDEYNSNIVDTYVAEGDTANHSGEQKLFYGVKSGKIHRVYIKINDLPAIDASMPVYSATMSLTYLTGTKTGKAVEIFKVNSVWSPATITYDAQPFYSFLYRTTFDASKPVTFDLTSDVPKLYNGYSNNGYLIKYVDEGKDNPDYNGFWSSEYTTSSKRPVLTVKYGYSLPSFLTNGSVYSFQNVGSGSFMTVHNGKDANYTNVYQKNTTVASLTASQKFRIEQVSSTGGYLLRAMCSSDGTNRVVDIQRVGTENFVKSGNNAYLYTATAPKTQQWFIVGVGTNQFKIVLRSNMNLALTAYGTADGTSGGTSSTSAGNVFLSTYSDSNYQKWKIIDSYGDAVRADDFIFNGTYYINNISSGKFIQNKSTGLCGVSGLVKRIGTSIKWKITPVGKAGVVQCYVIQPVSDTSQYLAAHSLLASQPSLEHISSTDISDNFKWVIDGSGIRNVASNKYLRFKVNADGTYDVELSSTKSRWRVVKSETYDSRELKSDFTISSGTTFVTDNVDLSIAANPGNAFWVSKSDFTYTVKTQSDAGNVAVDNSKGTILANTEGETLILATHKVTGLTCEFKVSAEYHSVVVPVAFASGSSYNRTLAFPVYLEYYLAEYSNLLSGAIWKAYDNGVITFDSQNMTVTGKAPGYAWLEASKNGKTIFVCYIYSDNIFKDITDVRIKDYLFPNGSDLGTMSCLKYEQDHKLDPIVLRVEWYLYAVKLLDDGKTDKEIQAELKRKFGLDIVGEDLLQRFLNEIDCGRRGGLSRENMKMSLDGLRSLFNFYWMQYAMYTIANLDTVNVYTPATENDVRIENAYARQLCKASRNGIRELNQNASSLSLKSLQQVDPKIRNDIWAARYGSADNPPYDIGAPVIKYETTKNTRFVRVFEKEKFAEGSWVCNPADIAGLSPAQIQEKFALPQEPKMICDITVPAGTIIYSGTVNSAFHSSGMGIQYELESKPLAEWISNIRNLQS